MDIKELNQIFDSEGRPKTEDLPDFIKIREIRPDTPADVKIHEYQIDDTIVLMPDYGAARAYGESDSEQFLSGAAGIQERINALMVDADAIGKSVLIYNPNPTNAALTAQIGYVNGINTLVVDQAVKVNVSDFSADVQSFVEQGGEIRSGGSILMVREDLGLGSPVSLLNVGTGAGKGVSPIGIERANLKGLGQDLLVSYLSEQISDALAIDPNKIPLASFGQTAVIDAHGDSLVVVGSLIGIAGKTPVTSIGANLAKTYIVDKINENLNQTTLTDLDTQSNVIAQQLGDGWLEGTSISSIGQGPANPVSAEIMSKLLWQHQKLGKLLDNPEFMPNSSVRYPMSTIRSEAAEALDTWQGVGDVTGLAIAMASPNWQSTVAESVEANTQLFFAAEHIREMQEYRSTHQDMPEEAIHYQVVKHEDVLPELQSNALQANLAYQSLTESAQAAAQLLEPGVPLYESGVLKAWYGAMDQGELPHRAISDHVLDSHGDVRPEYIDQIDTLDMRSNFDAQYSGDVAGREAAYLEYRTAQATEKVFESGITSRNYAELRDLNVPGNRNAYSPSDSDTSLQPLLEMDLSIDGDKDVLSPHLEMDLDLTSSLGAPDRFDSGNVDPATTLSRDVFAVAVGVRHPLDTDARRLDFAGGLLNPLQVAGAGEPVPLTASQKAAFEREYGVYLEALEGGTEAELLGLDVPGNAHAPGYYAAPGATGGLVGGVYGSSWVGPDDVEAVV